MADGDPEGAGGCRGENLFKLEALDRKASIGVIDLEKQNKTTTQITWSICKYSVFLPPGSKE